MSLFEKAMLWGIESCDETFSCMGKVFIIQLAKAIPFGLVAFLISLTFCSLDASAAIGICIVFAFGMGGMSVFN